MAGCSFVTGKDRHDKSKDVLCGLVPQQGSVYCPRHTFLHNISAAAARDKEYARQEERRSTTSGLPRTRAQLIERGYQFTGNKECYACGKPIEWWKTPASRPSPWDPMPEIDSHAVSHFATCERTERFRRAS